MDKVIHMDNDDELFLLIRKKDKQAFSHIYDKYHRLIYVTALDYLKDSMLAEEVVQQTFLDLWENAYRLSVSNSLKNYLYTMAKNLILKMVKQRNKDVVLAYEWQIIQNSVSDDPSGKFIEEKNYTELYKAIDKLPEKIRRVCLLKLEGNMNNEEISKTLGISLKTVKNDYNNAIRLLRRLLKGRIAYEILLLIIGGFRG